MKCILDIETDGLLDTMSKVHCIVAYDIDKKQPHIFIGDECITKFSNFAQGVSEFIMHNGMSFDAVALNRICNANIMPNKITDTLILSQLFNPVRDGGHSLSAWGERFKMPKGGVDSFDYYTPAMLDYCKRDVNITYKLYQHLKNESKGFSKQSVELEHKVRNLIDQQERTGFYLDIPYASMFVARLADQADSIHNQLQEVFPATVITGRTHKTSGKPLRDIVTPFNPGSRKQIGERLIELGWKPTKKTDKGHVIVDEAVLSGIDIPEAQLISKYLVLQKRYAQVSSWIEAVQDDGRVHGRVLTLRTITGRMAHTSPNMAQVPASYSPYGEECRTCWRVENENTHQLVGTDASGLELRGLAHYMNDSKFTQEILEGDVHTANMKMAGLTNRDQAKTFIYALCYGAGPAKIGSVVGGSSKEGQILIDRFLNNMPKLKSLRTNLTEAAESGVIKGLDGRLIHIRNSYSAVNSLIQGAGAVVCKQWLVQMIKEINAQGLDAKLVASIHDEYQFEVSKKDVDQFGKITKDSIKKVEQVYDLKCPLDSEFKVGKTWAETH